MNTPTDGKSSVLNRRVLFVLLPCMLAVGVIAFGVGMLVQYQLQVGVMHALSEMTRGLSVDDPDAPPSPSLEDWHYPHSRSIASANGTEVKLNGIIVRPRCQFALLVTSDSYADVVRHYAQKMQFEDPEQQASGLMGQGSESKLHSESDKASESADNLFVSDNFLPDTSQQPRPLLSKALIRRTSSYDLTVFITRAHDEQHTHVLLVYTARKATARTSV